MSSNNALQPTGPLCGPAAELERWAYEHGANPYRFGGAPISLVLPHSRRGNGRVGWITLVVLAEAIDSWVSPNRGGYCPLGFTLT